MKYFGKYIVYVIAFLSCNSAFSQNFLPMDKGVNSLIRSLLYDSINNILYAGGNFNFNNLPSDSTKPINCIAKWNGVTWDSLGSGVTYPYVPYVMDMIMYNGNLIISGNFNTVGGILSKGVALWDGSTWQHFADAVNNNIPISSGSVSRLYVNGNDLYIGGIIDSINGAPAYNLAKFDGTSWTTFPSLGINGRVGAIIVFNNELYVGGNFSLGPGKEDIVKFDGTNWVSMGGGLSGPNTWVYDFAIFQNQLYVAGYFNTSQGDPGNNVVIWDGNSWSQADLGTMPATVTDLYEFNSELYAAGAIDFAGGNPVHRIAKWDGNTWYPLPGNPFFNNTTTCFASDGNSLFIGGGFTRVNSDTMNYITQFNPLTSLQDVENNLNNVSIFPCPTNSKISIELATSNKSIDQIKIYNLIGKLLISENISNSLNKTEIDLSLSLIHI